MNLAERVEVERPVRRGPAPGDLEVVEVRGIDLVERRILGPPEVPGVGWPLAVRRALLGRGRIGREAHEDEDARDGDGRDRLHRAIIPGGLGAEAH